MIELFKKQLPHNTESEQSVLSAVLHDKDWADKILDEMKPDDFYHEQHQYILNAMHALRDKKKIIDTVTLTEILSEYGSLKSVGGAKYLLELYECMTTIHHTEHYLELLKKYSAKRKIITQAESLINNINNPELDNTSALNIFNEEMQGLSSETEMGGFKKIGQFLDKVQKKIIEPKKNNGLPTGFANLDYLVNGLCESEFIVLAGRPSSGKSTLALNIARNVAQRNKHVAFLSLEMPEDQLASKLVDSVGHDNYHSKALHGRFEHTTNQRFESALKSVETLNISIDDTGGLDISQVRTRFRRLHEKDKIDLIVIDYLQFIHCSKYKDSKVNQISEISRSLKNMAKELKVPVIALAQLSRAVEMRQDKSPIMSDLRDSGSIEQDADKILMIYRDDYYKPNNIPKDNLAQIFVRKNRNGQTGSVMLEFNGYTSNFTDTRIN